MCDFGNFGGAGDGVYNNGFNTLGMGEPVAPGNDGFGSGDIFTPVMNTPFTKRSRPVSNQSSKMTDPRPLIVSVAGRVNGTRKKTSVKKPK